MAAGKRLCIQNAMCSIAMTCALFDGVNRTAVRAHRRGGAAPWPDMVAEAEASYPTGFVTPRMMARRCSSRARPRRREGLRPSVDMPSLTPNWPVRNKLLRKLHRQHEPTVLRAVGPVNNMTSGLLVTTLPVRTLTPTYS